MEGLNQTWEKLDDGTMVLISEEFVEILPILQEPDIEDLLFRIFQRLDELESKSERLT